MTFNAKTFGSTTPRPWLWARLSTKPASRFEILGLLVQCVRSSQSEFIDAAKNGERDPTRLHEQALKALGIEDTSMLVVSVGREPPVPTYALVTHAA